MVTLKKTRSGEAVAARVGPIPSAAWKAAMTESGAGDLPTEQGSSGTRLSVTLRAVFAM